MVMLAHRWQTLRQTVARVAESDLARQVRARLVQDVPAWLLEIGALAPAEMGHVGMELARGLDQLARAANAERKTLRAWHLFGGHRALSLKLALDRIMGALVPLEATLARSTLALRHSDPRLAAIGANTAYPSALGRATATPGGVTSGPLAALSARDYRTLAERLRGALREAARTALAVQRALDGERSTNPCALAGAIEQTQTLAMWLHQECADTACHLLRRTDG